MSAKDNRAVMTYVAVVTLAMGLLAMVLQNLAVFIGIVVLIWSLALVRALYGRNKEDKTFVMSPWTRKFVARCAVVCMALSVLITYLSLQQPAFEPETSKFILENTGVGLLFAAFAGVLVLHAQQRFVYWPFWERTDKEAADERQKMVRNRVYEKSYRTVLTILIVLSLQHASTTSRWEQEIFWTIALCLFGIPAIIAAHQKDS